MGRGLNSYTDKERRKARRQNHEDYDLRYPKKIRGPERKPSKYKDYYNQDDDE